jgi:hypothetical protein
MEIVNIPLVAPVTKETLNHFKPENYFHFLFGTASLRGRTEIAALAAKMSVEMRICVILVPGKVPRRIRKIRSSRIAVLRVGRCRKPTEEMERVRQDFLAQQTLHPPVDLAWRPLRLSLGPNP